MCGRHRKQSTPTNWLWLKSSFVIKTFGQLSKLHIWWGLNRATSSAKLLTMCWWVMTTASAVSKPSKQLSGDGNSIACRGVVIGTSCWLLSCMYWSEFWSFAMFCSDSGGLGPECYLMLAEPSVCLFIFSGLSCTFWSDHDLKNDQNQSRIQNSAKFWQNI